jgi:hypothetical protein
MSIPPPLRQSRNLNHLEMPSSLDILYRSTHNVKFRVQSDSRKGSVAEKRLQLGVIRALIGALELFIPYSLRIHKLGSSARSRARTPLASIYFDCAVILGR